MGCDGLNLIDMLAIIVYPVCMFLQNVTCVCSALTGYYMLINDSWHRTAYVASAQLMSYIQSSF